MKTSKRVISLLLSLMLVLGTVSVGGVSVSADGDGIEFNEADNRYEISNYAGLKKFADIVNGESGETQNSSACAKLMKDIDASASAEANDWTPIGNNDKQYAGTFDGLGHKITGLTFNNPGQDYAGLFGVVGEGGKVMNVGLEGGSITGAYNVGGVAGRNYGMVTGCYNTGDVSGSGRFIGGVVGENSENSSVENSYNTGTVSGGDYVGGVVGDNAGRSSVENCYNTGSVFGMNYAGGVVGRYYSGSVINSYYDKTAVKIDGASEDNNWKAIGNSEIATVKGLTTEAMTAGTYTDGDSGYVSNMPGFSSDTWLVRKPDIFGEYYPHLRGFEYDNTGVVADWPAHILSQNGNTADNPYEIETYAQLKDFASIVNKENNSACAKLMNDIEFINEDGTVAKDWTPIGYCEHDETGKVTFDAAFIGTFDGDGHVITGLTCNDSSAEYAGLFGYVDAKSDTAKGNVKNVGLEGGNINGGSYAGGVVGYNNGGTVQSCYNTGDVSGSDYVGGVVGLNNGGTVTNCYNTGDVSGNGNVGGVAGDSGSPDGIKKVDNCYYDKSVCGNIGAVSGADIDTEDNKVKGLTTAQMTGRNAICYDHEDIDIHPMYFNYDDAESPWLPKDDGADEASGKYYWYYPQLKGFNKKADGTPETDPSQILPSDWPAKAEVSVTWSGADSYAYDGSGHSPCVAIGDISFPEGGDATYSAYNGSGWGTDTYDFPTLPGKYRMTISFGGNIITKYFEILNPDTDYRVSYYAKTGEPAWSSVPVAPVDVGEYKAVVTFTASGHKRMEKEFTVTPRLIWHVSEAGLENTSFTYDGTEKEPELAFLKDTLINKELVEGVDYRILHIEWKNNVNASDPEETDDEKLPAAVIDIEGMGNYYHSLTYTLFFTIEKADPEVTAPVPVEGLKCDGSMKELVTPGKTTGGTLEYSLDGEDYSPDIPRAAEEGGYTVYYRVTGNENYNDVEAQTVSAAIGENIHTITFIVDGEKTVVSYNYGSPVEKPADPAKEGYIFAWVDEIPATMPAQDVTINGKFTAIEYTATFVDENGETVKAVKFTVETEKLDEPAVPEKEGYTGKWEEYTLGANDTTIKPVYEIINSIEIENIEEQTETGYKEDQTFTVDTSDLPDGAEVHWFVNGEDVGTGESYTVENPTEDYTIQAKVIDKDGNVVSESEEQKVTVKNGFFDRLKAFFADLIEKILGKAIADLLSSVC